MCHWVGRWKLADTSGYSALKDSHPQRRCLWSRSQEEAQRSSAGSLKTLDISSSQTKTTRCVWKQRGILLPRSRSEANQCLKRTCRGALMMMCCFRQWLLYKSAFKMCWSKQEKNQGYHLWFLQKTLRLWCCLLARVSWAEQAHLLNCMALAGV